MKRENPQRHFKFDGWIEERSLMSLYRKRVDGLFPGRPQSFRYQCRPVDDCSPGQGGMAQDGGTRGGTFHDEMDCWSEARAGLRHAGVCPNVAEGTNERIIARSKRARAGSLAIVD